MIYIYTTAMKIQNYLIYHYRNITTSYKAVINKLNK